MTFFFLNTIFNKIVDLSQSGHELWIPYFLSSFTCPPLTRLNAPLKSRIFASSIIDLIQLLCKSGFVLFWRKKMSKAQWKTQIVVCILLYAPSLIQPFYSGLPIPQILTGHVLVLFWRVWATCSKNRSALYSLSDANSVWTSVSREGRCGTTFNWLMSCSRSQHWSVYSSCGTYIIQRDVSKISWLSDFCSIKGVFLRMDFSEVVHQTDVLY